MRFTVHEEQQPGIGGPAGLGVVLGSSAGERALVSPALGFNCVGWRVGQGETAADLLYADPQVFAGAKPTRSGIPILFPFPNRIRAGRFRWAGREYQLPLTDPAQANAIHGWACRRPWRVVDRGADALSAWVQAEFWASRDAPDITSFWPADYRLRVRYQLQSGRLRFEAIVENPDRVALPFGLGLHPYFRLPLWPGKPAGDCLLQACVAARWELQQSLPTGQMISLDAARDLTRPRPVPDLELDDLYQAADNPLDQQGLITRGCVSQAGHAVCIRTTADFRQLVAYTPPHRQAVCLEPYSCITDAINLQPQGVDAGLRVLEPGSRWQGVVEFVYGPAAPHAQGQPSDV